MSLGDLTIQQPQSTNYPITSETTKTGPFTLNSSTVDYSDVFGLHVSLKSGHYYNFALKYSCTANSIPPSIDTNGFQVAIVANQSGTPIVGFSGSGLSSQVPTTGSCVDGFDLTNSTLPFFFYFENMVLGDVINAGGNVWQTITTTDFYVTVNAFGTPGSITFSSVTLEVVDFGLVLQGA